MLLTDKSSADRCIGEEEKEKEVKPPQALRKESKPSHGDSHTSHCPNEHDATLPSEGLY